MRFLYNYHVRNIIIILLSLVWQLNCHYHYRYHYYYYYYYYSVYIYTHTYICPLDIRRGRAFDGTWKRKTKKRRIDAIHHCVRRIRKRRSEERAPERAREQWLVWGPSLENHHPRQKSVIALDAVSIAIISVTTQNTATTCVRSYFCPWSRKTSEVVVHRALGLYFQQKLFEI